MFKISLHRFILTIEVIEGGMTLHKVYLLMIGLVQALKCTVGTISCTITMGF